MPKYLRVRILVPRVWFAPTIMEGGLVHYCTEADAQKLGKHLAESSMWRLLVDPVTGWMWVPFLLSKIGAWWRAVQARCEYHIHFAKDATCKAAALYLK
jgi:hypothetical protein